MTSTLYNLDVPDEQTDLKLKDASQKEIIEATYEAWLGAYKSHLNHPSEILYRTACRIINPFKEKLSGTLTEKDFGVMARVCVPHSGCRSNGLYLSALLNKTDVKKLSLGEFEGDVELFAIGYRLKQGKTLELRGDIYNLIAEDAEGGAVINNGRFYSIGTCASGGTFLNEADSFGDEAAMGGWARGGVFLNLGDVSSMGKGATGGIFLNEGLVWSNMGYEAAGGIFITRELPESEIIRFSENLCGDAIGIGPDELAEDEELSELMDKVEKAGKASDVLKVKQIARKVDAHVRKNYEPRKIA